MIKDRRLIPQRTGILLLVILVLTLSIIIAAQSEQLAALAVKNHQTGLGPSAVATADHDGDGDVDLVGPYFSPSTNGLSVFVNKGNGVFACRIDYGVALGQFVI